MTMSYLWTGMILISVIFSFLTGQTEQVSTASLQGATTAIDLCLTMAGGLCLWSGMMEVMRQSGLSNQVANALRPLLKHLFPEVAKDEAVMEHISANLSANFLGLGNAATPLGIQSAKGLAKYSKNGRATASLCLFVVCNTASIQAIPSTIASLRLATGSASPFEILPALWLTSATALTVGIALCKIWEHFGRKTP